MFFFLSSSKIKKMNYGYCKEIWKNCTALCMFIIAELSVFPYWFLCLVSFSNTPSPKEAHGTF